MVDQITILRGEKTFLKDFLINQLNECGWSDKVRLMCREEIAKANGKPTTLDSLVEKVTSKARSEIPDSVKEVCIKQIKSTLLLAESSNED